METYSEYLEHYGVKGMRWGVRRTLEQLGHKKNKRHWNEDGLPTHAGRRKLAKELKADYKQNYDRKNPFKTSSSYNKKLFDSVNRVITDDDKKRITNSFKQWLSKQEEADRAIGKLDKLAKKYGQKYYNDEIKRNPDAYTTSRDRRKLREFAEFDFGMDKAIEERPDLDKAQDIADKAWTSYEAEVRSISDNLLGRYGDVKLSQSKDYPLQIKDTVDSMVYLMERNHWNYKTIEDLK